MKIKKFTGICIIGILLIVSIVLAQNIEFKTDIENRMFYPNETISFNISLSNRDMRFSAKNATLFVNVSGRSFVFDVGDLNKGQEFVKGIKLPEFPPGDYIIKSELHYIDLVDKPATKETFGSFHVRFPEMERFPRNIVIKEFEIPENLIQGQTYNVKVKISNEGEIDANILASVKSLDLEKSKNLTLKSGESESLDLDVNFYNSGISVVEARVYAIIDGEKYLLDFKPRNVFIKESYIADLKLEKIELVDEPDNEINQNDEMAVGWLLVLKLY